MKTVFYKSKQWLKKALYCLFDVLQEFQRENSELKTRNTEVRGVFFNHGTLPIYRLLTAVNESK